MIKFREFEKIARLSRPCAITEKIDGTNAQVHIRPACTTLDHGEASPLEFGIDTQVELNGEPAYIRAGSRNRWISQGKTTDNAGFAAWVYQHAHELAGLGFGQHFGEWWGQGIQRNYGLAEKRWSLFNTARWSDDTVRPACCHVVPVLAHGIFSSELVDFAIRQLSERGSFAAPGFVSPEGIIVWHEAARTMFKKTLVKDEEWKGKAT